MSSQHRNEQTDFAIECTVEIHGSFNNDTGTHAKKMQSLIGATPAWTNQKSVIQIPDCEIPQICIIPSIQFITLAGLKTQH